MLVIREQSKSEVGGCSTGKSFRFVRACVRAVWLPSGIGSKIRWAGLFPFPFGPGLVVGLFFFWASSLTMWLNAIDWLKTFSFITLHPIFPTELHFYVFFLYHARTIWNTYYSAHDSEVWNVDPLIRWSSKPLLRIDRKTPEEWTTNRNTDLPGC